MSRLTLYKALFCFALLFSILLSPASALSREGDPAARLQRLERKVPASGSIAAKMAFVQSLSQRNASPRNPGNQKARPVSCEESWFFGWTKCCSETMCCTWYGDGNGPRCI
jgi:hypothetical protein